MKTQGIIKTQGWHWTENRDAVKFCTPIMRPLSILSTMAPVIILGAEFILPKAGACRIPELRNWRVPEEKNPPDTAIWGLSRQNGGNVPGYLAVKPPIPSCQTHTPNTHACPCESHTPDTHVPQIHKHIPTPTHIPKTYIHTRPQHT